MARTGRSVSIYLDEKLEKELDSRSDKKSEVVDRDLFRLYFLYKDALRSVKLSIDEGALLCNVLTGIETNNKTAYTLWMEVEEHINANATDPDKNPYQFNVDFEALIVKIKNYSPLQCIAIIDAVERILHNAQEDESMQRYLEKYLGCS